VLDASVTCHPASNAAYYAPFISIRGIVLSKNNGAVFSADKTSVPAFEMASPALVDVSAR